MISKKDLYKGRYLIAIYDNKERLIGVETDLQKVKKYFDLSNSYYLSYKRIRDRNSNKIIFIDCLENHNDCFKEEDKEFIKFIEENHIKDIDEIIKELGISKRTYYRRKKENLL